MKEKILAKQREREARDATEKKEREARVAARLRALDERKKQEDEEKVLITRRAHKYFPMHRAGANTMHSSRAARSTSTRSPSSRTARRG